MSIVVTCSCGKSFKAKEEHAGKQARCRACGKMLVIAEAQPEVQEEEEEVITFDDSPKPRVSTSRSAKARRTRQPQPEPEAEEEGQYEEEAPAPRRGKGSGSGAIVIAGLAVAAVIIGAAVYLLLSPKPNSNGSAKKTSTDETKVTEAPRDEEYFDALSFNKGMLEIPRSIRVKFQGSVTSTMSDDASIVVQVAADKRVTEKGTTNITYKLRLYTAAKLTYPLTVGQEIVFKGRLQPKPTQTYSADDVDGKRVVIIDYEMRVKEVEILGTPVAK